MGAVSVLDLPQQASLLLPFVEEMEACNAVPLGHWPPPSVSSCCVLS